MSDVLTAVNTSSCALRFAKTDTWWMGLHAERPDVVALHEQQRQVRIKLGWEVSGGTRRIF